MYIGGLFRGGCILFFKYKLLKKYYSHTPFWGYDIHIYTWRDLEHENYEKRGEKGEKRAKNMALRCTCVYICILYMSETDFFATEEKTYRSVGVH